ncbi:MAG: hypothetical protein WD716_02350 [Fimbriimonadaceae bacterium]
MWSIAVLAFVIVADATTVRDREARAAEGLSTIELEASDGVWAAKASIEVGDFVRENHTYSLKKLSPDTSQRVIIDGKFAWGLEGTNEIEYPSKEIRSVSVDLAGTVINLPGEAFADCYEPSTAVGEKSKDGKSYRWRYYYIWVSSVKKLARIKMIGSDGTGGYRVVWTVHSNGKWSREINLSD